MGPDRLELPRLTLLRGAGHLHLALRRGHLSCRLIGNWWSWSGSNRRPPECKSGALPAELQPLHTRCNRGRLDAAAHDKHEQREVNQTLRVEIRSRILSLRLADKTLPHPQLDRKGCYLLDSVAPATVSLRKEVIQPQVLLRLPCYDFTPIMNHTLDRCLPCRLACRLLVQSTFVM